MQNTTKQALEASLKSLIHGVVEEKAAGLPISKEDKDFIAGFYKYNFVGIMLDWIRQGMKEDYKDLVEKTARTLHGNIANSIQNFAAVKAEKNLT